MTILILHQFSGPTPYSLHQEPYPFAELLAEVQAHPEEYGRYERPRIVEAERCPALYMAETAYAAGPDGRTVVVGMHWDSSG